MSRQDAQICIKHQLLHRGMQQLCMLDTGVKVYRENIPIRKVENRFTTYIIITLLEYNSTVLLKFSHKSNKKSRQQ